MLKSIKRSVAIFALGLPLFGASAAWGAKLERAAVMAPLMIQDGGWDHFKVELAEVKKIGVDAVSTDVWWGLAEKTGDQRFDWTYYDRLSDAIIEAGLQWVPILSFHGCGGNVGDDVNIPIPAWLWARFPLGEDDLRYRSEQGNFSVETLSLWADDTVKDQYREFMEAFKLHFAAKAAAIAEINLSCGPAGELRYPSYNAHDQGAGWPQRGALQCYGHLAETAFRAAMLKKYGSLTGLNRAWGTALKSVADIRPPSNASGFFDSHHYADTAYGRDLLAWYNQSLLAHGKLMIELAEHVFDGAFAQTVLGVKIPGVHWRMADPAQPRVAEICAGLIPTDIDFQSDATVHGYAPIIGMIAGLNGGAHRVVLHFTCLEMGNDDHAPAYSQAENLVFWLAAGAQARGVAIMGENALDAGVGTDFGWGRIDNAFRHASYTGLTVLRIGQVTDNSFGKNKYRDFIHNLKSNQP